MNKLRTFLFTVAALLAAGSAFAQWTWIDNAGHKVFSDRAPPANVPAKNILKRPGGTSAPVAAKAADDAPAADTVAAKEGSAAKEAKDVKKDAAPKSAADKQLEEKKKKAEEAEAAKKKAEDEKITKEKADNCQRAKDAKATVDSGARIARINAQGERSFMDDADRQVETKRLQGIIDSSCK